ncbi:hypothetical protein FALBO_2663 [Fusarium albosuccineum]|uniref:Uncharacterized protein n=1 Tax=Fusarium albosuccineum TaxID=1237068 RepID=A0A8H4PGN3_9HYPO|nr:hypothetical protein FALBO_2663 [Fusarium albosuccineum]
MVVPDDLTILRNSVETAADVLDCRKCPLRFSSVLQNATILGVLCVCLAESYVRFSRTIDAKAKEASEAGEKLCLSLGGINGSSGNSPPAVMVEVSAEEWKGLMHNAVKTEICGMERHRDKCFMSFIERLEERQREWHEQPLAPDCPPTYQSTCQSIDETPLCLVIIGAAKKVLSQIPNLME